MKRSNLLAIAVSLGTASFLLCGASFAPSVLASSKKATSISINAANFPNAAFREYVREFDLDNNGSFSEKELKYITDIDISENTAVTNLKGIEYFTFLEALTCDDDNISSLDLSKNTRLFYLSCSNNNISSLNLSNNKNLEVLYCENNNLTTINLTSNPELYGLYVSGNPITSLNVSKNPKLDILDCADTKISTLNVSANPLLTWINCYDCKNLSSIDVTKCTNLETLSLGNTKVSSINVTKNTKLTNLDLYNTYISSLNVKNNPKLDVLDCGDTDVSSLDVSKNTLLTHMVVSGTLITSLNVSNCKKLEFLYCCNTKLSTLNISNNRNLKTLDVSITKISTLDISSCPYLLTTYAANIVELFEYEKVYMYDDKKEEMTYYLYINPTTTIRTTPGALSTLSASPAGKNAVKISWQFSGVADGYLIYGQKNGKYGYVGMTTKGTSFTDTKALSENYNFYWVFPYTKDTKGNMYVGSCTKYVYAKGTCPAVTNLKATSVKGGVKLTWTAAAGADGYLIYGIVGGKPYKYLSMTSGTVYTDKTASSTQYNYYWVYPYFKNSNGNMVVGPAGNYTYGRALP